MSSMKSIRMSQPSAAKQLAASNDNSYVHNQADATQLATNDDVQPVLPLACPDLHYIDRKLRELRYHKVSYEHPAAAGYSSIEIEDLIEEHRERYMRYALENPMELRQYIAERASHAVI